MRVLVTGGAGYIGSHTCLELISSGYDVVAVDNYGNSSPEAVRRVKELAGRDFPVYEADVRDADALDGVLSRHECGAAIHFAGLKAVGESVREPLRYYANNIESTVRLCEAMKRRGVRNLVFSSSATVYSGDNAMPLDEDSKTGGCTNPYGWTKYMGERILTDAAAADPDLSVALLRYFNPIGAHESGRIGEDPADIPNNLLPFITQTAVGRLECLNVYGDDYPTPDGTGVRDYIHVLDLARGHVSAIRRCESRKGVEAFNLGTGRGTSVLELVAAFERVSGKKLPYRVVGRRPGDLPICYAATEKAKRELGWNAEKSVEDACRDSWRWQSSNPNGYNP